MKGSSFTGRHIKRTVEVGLLVVLLPIATPSETDPLDICVEFLEHHSDEETWMSACIDAMYAESSPIADSHVSRSARTQSAWFRSYPGLVCETNINMSRLLESQQEVAIAIDPKNPSRLFAFSNTNPAGSGLFAAYSVDSGVTWTKVDTSDGTIADGDPDGLPIARGDPWASWDEFGNLFITYFSVAGPAAVALSTNGGQSFTLLATLGTFADRPAIATGAGSVWVVYMEGLDSPVVQGAAVTGFGAIGSFQAPQAIALGPPPRSPRSPDIVITRGGRVLVSYQEPLLYGSFEGPDQIWIALDLDGLGGGGFGSPHVATGTNVGIHDDIPAQPQRAMSATAGLAYDNSGGPHDGRVYLAYADEISNESNDTDIFVRYSDDDGATWSDPPVRVNDDPVGPIRSQFLPRIAVDPASGTVGVSWHDARNDSADMVTQMFAAISINGGSTFLPNVQISAGGSNQVGGQASDYGDYTGLAFAGGRFHPSWGDNSNSTSDNPNGNLSLNDAYTVSCTADSDLDGVLDAADNCQRVPNAPPFDCDRDNDGYGNACDGDFDQSNTTNAADFSTKFLPDFKAGVDSGVGTDMSCTRADDDPTPIPGEVDAVDFSDSFLPNFEAGKPGPSGLACAGTVPCPAL